MQLNFISFWCLLRLGVAIQRCVDIMLINEEHKLECRFCLRTAHHRLAGCFIDPGRNHTSVTQVGMIYLRDYRCLPQNFVPAVSASVPLTAIQVTDADLLKIEENTPLSCLRSPNNPKLYRAWLQEHATSVAISQELKHCLFWGNVHFSPTFRGERCFGSSTAAVTVLHHAEGLLNLSDSLTNPLQS